MEAMNKALPVEWFWYRYEWQARASIHMHGFIKLHNDPGVASLMCLAHDGHIAKRRLQSEAEGKGDSDISGEERSALEAKVSDGEVASATVCRYAD